MGLGASEPSRACEGGTCRALQSHPNILLPTACYQSPQPGPSTPCLAAPFTGQRCFQGDAWEDPEFPLPHLENEEAEPDDV